MSRATLQRLLLWGIQRTKFVANLVRFANIETNDDIIRVRNTVTKLAQFQKYISNSLPTKLEIEPDLSDKFPTYRFLSELTNTNIETKHAILFAHGGAFVAGNVITHQSFANMLCIITGLPVSISNIPYRIGSAISSSHNG